MKNLLSILTILIFSAQLSICQHYYDDAFTAQKTDSYSIDGVGDESFWEQCDWYDIEYIWIPYGTAMSAGDFTGRVKFAWTEEVLLVLAEIEDDVLSDVHPDPQDNYWNDDCFEVFLDEDYSGGWHQTSYNAFAYHCAINEEDVIDSGDDNAFNVYVNDHVDFNLDTVDNTHYVWELAITVYDDSFNESNPTNTTVTLSHNKEMGIAVAYCDNDGGSERENFIGLIDVAAEHYNSAWQDASVFGKLTLNDPDAVPEGIGITAIPAEDIKVFQDNNSNLIIENPAKTGEKITISVFDLNGRLIMESSESLDERVLLNIHNITQGTYIINLRGETMNYSKMICKY
ncbi:MAG: T9SS type A sorting domain-containing protein [Bacteroidales bacterium]|nr:T9SS type A sorting domain-containing protein [Bacteroidales bacterium]